MCKLRHQFLQVVLYLLLHSKSTRQDAERLEKIVIIGEEMQRQQVSLSVQ